MTRTLVRDFAPAGLPGSATGLIIQVASQAAETYPPYDIVEIDDRRLRIIIAVAGFTIDDLSVSVTGNTVAIRGRRPATERQTVYVHRGIATRQFQRTFAIDDAVEVTGAALDRGLLSIELERRSSDEEPKPSVARVPERRLALTGANTGADGRTNDR